MVRLSRLNFILLFLSILFFSGAAVMIFVTVNEQNEETELQLKQARGETKRAVAYISAKVQLLETVAVSLVSELQKNKYTDPKTLEALLLRTSEENPDMFGIGVAYLPYKFNAEQRLYAPYVKREAGKPVLMRVEEVYDYTKPEYQWFHLPLLRGEMWQEPYYGDASESMLAEYTFPLYGPGENNRTAIAVGQVNYTLESMRGFLSSLELGKSGYGVILSKEGYVISHPDKELVNHRTNLETLAKEHVDKEMMRLVNSVAQKKAGEVSLMEMSTGRKARVFHQVIPKTGWTFLSVIFEKPTREAAQKFHRQMIIISLLILIGMLFTMVHFHRLMHWGEWTLVTRLSLLILAEIVIIWNLAVDEHRIEYLETVVSDQVVLEKWMDERRVDAQRHHNKEPWFIPTGLFIENVVQRTGHDIVISGYLWQQYKKGRDDGLRRGIEFVEIAETLSEEFIPLYTYQDADRETVGWQFRIVVREEYWPLRFPLDTRQIHLRLRHPDFLEGVRLIPDLDAYNLLDPASLPGVNQHIHIPGWKALESHFEFLSREYQTSFGVESIHRMSRMDDLSFNLKIKREFLGPFITYLIPMVVVSIMLFSLLLMVGRNDKDRLIGFSAMQILASTSGLFFVLIIAHSNFRATSEVPKVIYLENFYFLLYIAIVMVAIDALLFITRRDLNFIQYFENILPKLLYWPILLGALLAVTVGYFY
ncbi:MAG: hypothetical protein DRG24_09690 [Epsilonproteobacteria bacterium]|nr:MAG: hypothetical protein DRG24_09690 [Campylobacterota bacterium]